MKPLYIVMAAAVVSLGIFLSIYLGDEQKTVPKIKLSYYASTDEVSESIAEQLQPELLNEKYFWFGVEPEKTSHIDLAARFVKSLEARNGAFDYVFIDSELRLKPEEIAQFPKSEIVSLRENWGAFADKLKALDKKKYFVVTASIYTTSFLKQNPIQKVREKTQIRPTAFSVGYFSTNTEDEKNGLFHCSTDDRTGVGQWGCAMVNKSRTQRRRLEDTKKPFISLVDLAGEKDYMILLK